MTRSRRRFLTYGALPALVGALGACGLANGRRSQFPDQKGSLGPGAEPLLVSAASDLAEVLPQIQALWEGATGRRMQLNLGSTGQLAQQIERGAPVDLFLAASRSFVDALDRGGLIRPQTKQLYGIGRLTLWRRAGDALAMTGLEDLTKPAVRRIAIANPDHAPYGMAAREALQAVGLWEVLQPKLILGENIRQAQHYAERGHVDVAIAALAISLHRPGQWTLVPADLHRPLEQMLAIPARSRQPAIAQEFADWLVQGTEGRKLMRRYGFILPGETLDGP